MGTETFVLPEFLATCLSFVEKMGPLRGDGNAVMPLTVTLIIEVEKMGPLRGDGNEINSIASRNRFSREDGSPSWGRKPNGLHFLV